MIKRKGMTMAMQIVIVIIVLVVLALIVIGITRGQIFGGLGFLQNKGDQQECLSNRDIYCQNEPSGCWAASQEIISKSEEDKGKLCHNILGRSLENSYYSCGHKDYVHEDAMWMINATKLPYGKYNATGTDVVANAPSGEDGAKMQRNICAEFGYYWKWNDDNRGGVCKESRNDDAKLIDLSIFDKITCRCLQ